MLANSHSFNVGALLAAHRQSHHIGHWRQHEYTATIERGLVTYCVCESCTLEITEIAEQWTRDYDSMVESMRLAGERFLGFDLYEEWLRKTS